MMKKKDKLFYSVVAYGCPSCGQCHSKDPRSSGQVATVQASNVSTASQSTNCK